MDQITHWSHKHPLLLSEDNKMDNEQLTCGICDRYIENHSHFYVCDSCKFYVHKPCTKLCQIWPSFQCSSFHSDSHGPLTLHPHRHFYCHSCHQKFRNYPCFECNQCDFYMDVECALKRTIRINYLDYRIYNFTHQHPMLVVDEKADDEIKCFGCHSKSSSSGRVFGCAECKHFLHEECACLPETIQYPPHRIHGDLTLRVRHEWFTCKLCKKEDNRTLIFDCPQCNFRLCVKCGMTVKGTIRYEYHEHPLWFWDNPSADDKLGSCDGYDAYCKNPFISNSTELRDIQYSSILKCLNCDFKVHLMCGPLPSSIKYEYHKHFLFLKDSLIEDDCDEYFCDICESERDPRIRVYYCDECKYVAHVHCVVSEIKSALQEDDRNEKSLKSIGGDLWQLPHGMSISGEELADLLTKSSTTFKDLLDTLSADERLWFKADFYWDTSSHDQGNIKGQEEEVKSQSICSTDSLDLQDDYIDQLLKFSYFTEVDFKMFSYLLEQNFYFRKLKINSSYLALKTVEVKGYKIPFTLARVLEALLHRHKHILGEPESSISTRKSIVLSFVCEVMKQMHSTSVLDITKDQLEDWYFYLEFASHRAKFDVQFLKDPLQKITRAFFGFQLSKLDTRVPTALNKKIDELSHQKDVQHSKLVECLQFQTSPKSKFVTECLTEAAKFKWKIASKV